MLFTIILVVKKKIAQNDIVILIVRGGTLTLKLTIKGEETKTLLREFNVNNAYELAGKRAIVDIESGFLYRLRGFSIRKQTPMPVTCEVSFP